ncbi:MAG: radical SAM protein [Syntrophobacterales bacterium]|nr:radical SAM protein [Syntrophobacterales bacterium]
MSFLFGPVPSRRLGRSLGVDLVPAKTCCYDCIYCEVGPTTHLTVSRRVFMPPQAVLEELEDYLRENPGAPEVITLAGSGEPTLNAGLGEIIRGIKALTRLPVALLTNGALLHLPEVRREAARADLVLPSLDTARAETFRRLNRPHPHLCLEMLLAGLRAFRREFAGRLWLEVMLLKGLNDTEAELSALRRAIAEVAPDKVQLNTAVRPVVEESAQPLSPMEMTQAAAFLGGEVEVEIIAAAPAASGTPLNVSDEAYLKMLARRPMTAPDLARALGLATDEVTARLAELVRRGLLRREQHRQEAFYRTAPQAAARL